MNKNKLLTSVYDFASTVLSSVLIICVIFTLFFKTSTVSGQSMENTLYNGDTLSQCESDELIERVRQLGCKSVVITSASVEGENCVIGYDHTKDEKFKIGFELIDVRFPGTGDIFSAVLVSDVLNGECLYTATQHAMETVSNIIIDNLDKNEKFYGVDIERYISEGKL